MSRMRYVPILFLTIIVLTGCAKNDSSAVNATAETARASNANSTVPHAPPVANTTTAPPPTLSGDYILGEVQHNGQVTMIQPGNSTEISFRPDGTYARVSRIGGNVDHRDSGEFRIEAGQQLVLRINMWKKKIQAPPVEKKHPIILSPDGAELRMTGSDGKVGVFRRTRTLASG